MTAVVTNSGPTQPAPRHNGYAVWSRINLDEVSSARGTAPATRLGGAGTYAALGARMAAGPGPAVAVLAAVGGDLFAQYGHWFSSWGIDVFPGAVVPGLTPRSRLTYGPCAERTEHPSLGEEHFDQFELGARDVPDARLGCRGLYVFRQADRDFWEVLQGRCGEGRPTVLWEIDRRSCRPVCWPDIAHILPSVDLFSINEAEALALLGPDRASSLDALRSAFGGVLVYRMGQLGSYVAFGPRLLFVAAAPVAGVVDPTGAGNAFGGAFLARWCETDGGLGDAARAATAIAAMVVGHEGPLDNVESVSGPAVDLLTASVEVREVPGPGAGKEKTICQ